MFIPIAVGLLDSTGKDMPLTSVYSDGAVQTLSADGQPVFTTVLQFKKVRATVIIFLQAFPQETNLISMVCCESSAYCALRLLFVHSVLHCSCSTAIATFFFIYLHSFRSPL